MTGITISQSRTDALQLPLPGLIVTPGWVAQHLEHPGLRLLDVRSLEDYSEGHIPGALHLDSNTLICEVNGVEGMALPPDAFAHHMSRLGVDQKRGVVIYDDYWGLQAARVLWSLARYGHKNVAVLNGGWDRWQQEGRSQTSPPSTSRPAQFDPHPDDRHIAEYAWLVQQISRPDLVLLDTRALGEYQQGHLPGAVCWDWINGVPMDSWDFMRPPEELMAELADMGVTPDQEIVTYCRSGVRAAHTYLLLRSLGFPRVRLYDGSWLEWAHYQNGQMK